MSTSKDNKEFIPKKNSKSSKSSSSSSKKTQNPHHFKDKKDKKAKFEGAPNRKAQFKSTSPPRKKTQRKKIYADEVVEEKMPLNKYLAHAGIATRKEAVELIKKGLVKVNGQTELNPAYKVQKGDEIHYKDEDVKPGKDLVYVLYNKSKNTPVYSKSKALKTVMGNLQEVTESDLIPLSTLGNKDLGLLLLTNDGALIEQLKSKDNPVSQIYHLVLDREFEDADEKKLLKGITLDGQKFKASDIGHPSSDKKNEIGLEIGLGDPKKLKKLMQKLGYEILQLDRVVIGGLTKKNLSRGHFRLLKVPEIVKLKHFNK